MPIGISLRMLMVAGQSAGGGGGGPDAPSSLTATADGGYTNINVAWTDNSDNEDNFELQYDTDSGFGSPTTVEPAADAEFHQVTGLTRGTTYYFRVRAVNVSGNSAWSNTDNDTVFQLSDVTLYAEYDADNDVYNDAGSTLATDGQTVQEIHDQTGNGRHITQATGSAQPTLQTNEVNGHNVIRHASGDILQAATAADWKFMHDGTEFAAYVVWKTTSTSPNALSVLLDTGSLSNSYVGFGLWNDDRSGSSRSDQMLLRILNGSGSPEVEAQTVDEAVAAGQWHVAAARLTASQGELRSDGHWGGGDDDTPAGSASASNPRAALVVGGSEANSFNLIGDWARVIIVSGTVSDANHRAIQDYLSEEYDTFGKGQKYFGSASVIQAGSGTKDHLAFGGITIAPNGDLLVAYNRGSDHSTGAADLVMITSSDGGQTWSSETTIYDHEDDGGSTDMWGSPTLRVLSDNRILMAVGKRESGSTVVDGIGYFESDDNGQTWTGPTTVDSSFTEWAAEGGGIIELANGDLLYPHYGLDSGDASNRRSCRVSKSTNGGSTWAHLSDIADGPTEGRDLVEPGLVLLDNGDIVALIRQDNNDSIRYAKSTDSGATWATQAYATGGDGRCSPILLRGDGIIDIQRGRNAPSDTAQILYSGDGGDTWQLGHYFELSPNFTDLQMVYGQAVQADDGTVYVVYFMEDTGATIADVMFAKTE